MNYNNEGRPLSYYIKNFLLIFLFVVIIIFLLLWLLPNKSTINPISDQIFQNNLNNMKEATTSYYTKDRLPQDEDDSKKITLKEMLDMKLLMNVTDKNGKTCDLNNSYSEITKLENEYKLKVNLKCGDIEDYIVTYLGCYNYCADSSICEKQSSNKNNSDDEYEETEAEEAARHNVGGVAKEISNGSSYSNPGSTGSYTYNYSYNKKPKAKKTKKVKNKTVNITKITKIIINKITNITIVPVPDTPTPTPTPTEYSCEVVDGTYYDKNGNVVSPTEFEQSCKEPQKHYCEIVDGKYYDKEGNVVTGDEYEKSCKEEPEHHYCQVIDGTYYDKEGNIVTPSEYNNSCKEPQKHYCEIVDGKYYDKLGRVVTPTEYKNSCTEPEKHYCEIVDGNYYDKEGNIVNGDEYEESCKEEPEHHYCEIVDGKYYDDEGNVTSKSDYEEKGGQPEHHSCEIVDGKYYDREGNIVSKEDYEASCHSTKPKYRYQYEKTEKVCYDKQYSDWSDWSEDKEYDPENNNISWGQNEYTWYEKNGSKVTTYYEITEDRTKPIYNVSYDKLLGYKTQYACDGYTYFIDSATTTVYTTTTSATGWVYKETITTRSVPESTLTKKYEVVGVDYTKCNATCSLNPVYKVKVYTRTINTATDKVSSNEESLKAVCKFKETQIPIYGKGVTFAGYIENRELKEKTTYYYHERTRKLIHDAYCDNRTLYVWSYNPHDTVLINQGYRYNGIKEPIYYIHN